MIKIKIENLIFACRVSGNEEDELSKNIMDISIWNQNTPFLNWRVGTGYFNHVILRSNQQLSNIFPNIGLINNTYEGYRLYSIFHIPQ